MHILHVPLRTKLSFGIGQISEGLYTGLSMGFLMIFYNQGLMLSSDLVGAALFISMFSDAITDPLVGTLSDRWKSKWGRRHPFMFVSAIPWQYHFIFYLCRWISC